MKRLAKVEIIHTNGTRETHEVGKHILLPWIKRMIGADLTDTVNLRDAQGQLTGFVMIVNDRGYETQEIRHADRIELRPIKALLPVNVEATKMYHAQCKPGTMHQIVGDVAIAWDEDFA